MLKLSVELQQCYENSTPTGARKAKAQVFTPPEIARFMASMFSSIPSEYRLLDAGAGVGTLTAAVCERIASLHSPRRLTAHLFENDPQLIPLLRKNLENCGRRLCESGHVFEYVIHDEDFILATAAGLDGQRTFEGLPFGEEFDGAIMNPPYYKVRKDSSYAKLLDRLVHGQPNVYAFFMALAARLLKESGELVAITPRSFCNGLYFRDFRRWFFQRMGLDRVHLFESRTDAFKHSDVLQESIITKAHRLGKASERTRVTTSFGRNLGRDLRRLDVSAESILDNSCGDYVVRIPEQLGDEDVMAFVESFSQRFEDVGLRISTGPVVMFRATQFLLRDPDNDGSVPLLLPHNIKQFRTVWPLAKNGKPSSLILCDESLRLLLPTRNYVLLKRFSAKEEKRRLTASCFLGTQWAFSHIGIENHVNYVYHQDRELSEDEVYGIASLFNSPLLDRYFRTLSGNTQVNATEIRNMNFPSLRTIAKIGKKVKEAIATAEAVVLSELGVNAELREHLLLT
jgi:adenine-specific DNA-methyltransferase